MVIEKCPASAGMGTDTHTRSGNQSLHVFEWYCDIWKAAQCLARVVFMCNRSTLLRCMIARTNHPFRASLA
ncbi:hypothetical protein DES53_108255 [Roseimicrobium gellanilyticum]|uniref:Uncharacterized protein n=1 Tax=Roseimicrobium gellanilyticum TaxID=748857 RepID=A0A366HGG2_9BACT|nr:hypothetical protein DES53_108255 [Roseimicrobium gellanilyticum]